MKHMSRIYCQNWFWEGAGCSRIWGKDIMDNNGQWMCRVRKLKMSQLTAAPGNVWQYRVVVQILNSSGNILRMAKSWRRSSLLKGGPFTNALQCQKLGKKLGKRWMVNGENVHYGTGRFTMLHWLISSVCIVEQSSKNDHQKRCCIRNHVLI